MQHVHLYMCRYVFICIYMDIYVYIYIYTSTCKCRHIFRFMHVCIYILDMYMYMHMEFLIRAAWLPAIFRGQGVYPLTAVSRTWEVNKYTGIKARRSGFFVLPDFASTAGRAIGESFPYVIIPHDGSDCVPVNDAGFITLIRP